MKKLNSGVSTVIDLVLFSVIGLFSIILGVYGFLSCHYILGVVYLILFLLDLKIVWADIKILRGRGCKNV